MVKPVVTKADSQSHLHSEKSPSWPACPQVLRYTCAGRIANALRQQEAQRMNVDCDAHHADVVLWIREQTGQQHKHFHAPPLGACMYMGGSNMQCDSQLLGRMLGCGHACMKTL